MIKVVMRELCLQISWKKIMEIIKDDLAELFVICWIMFPMYGWSWNGVHLLLAGTMSIACLLSKLSQNRGVMAFYLAPLSKKDKEILFQKRYLVRSLVPAVCYGIGAAVLLFRAPEAWLEFGYGLILLLLYSFCKNLYVGGSVTTKSAENHDRIEAGKWETEEYELRTWLKEQIKRSMNWRERRKSRKTESRWDRTLRRMRQSESGLAVAVLLGWQPFLLGSNGINGMQADNMIQFWKKSTEMQQGFIVVRTLSSVLLFTAYLACFYRAVRELAGNYEETVERSIQ